MSGFQFKQFFVEHSHCAMKVGTDGILLGSWVEVSNAKRILDLGTGTGLIALMLAQRTSNEVQISAVELDPAAAIQAKQNFQNSPWVNRLNLFQQEMGDFCQKCGEKNQQFDLIVANPPYFEQGVNCTSLQRNLARYTQNQSHLDWLNTASQCLTTGGKIQFILPFEQGKTLIKQTAVEHKIYCTKRCDVITKQGKAPQRMLIEFQRHPFPLQQSELVIYNSLNQYTDEFVALTRDFYLKM